MNHSFQPSLSDGSKCAKCKRGLMDHTEMAQCECCPNVGPCNVFPDGSNILMCASCFAKAESIHQSPEKQEQRVRELREREKQAHVAQISINQVLKQSTEVDQSIQLVTDIFNAKTVAIVELKNAIEADPNIENKPYALAEHLTNRMVHLKQVIAESKQQLTDWENEQRATQVYLNQMANTLRAEERAKLKIADINYQPTTKAPSKPRAPKKKKIDVSELKDWAAKVSSHTGIPVQHNVLHMIMISNNFASVEAAARHWSRQLGKELP